MCDGKNHDLIEIYWTYVGYGAYEVVRWCGDCGAVVIDTDVDGRILAGHVRNMRFPKILTGG